MTYKWQLGLLVTVPELSQRPARSEAAQQGSADNGISAGEAAVLALDRQSHSKLSACLTGIAPNQSALTLLQPHADCQQLGPSCCQGFESISDPSVPAGDERRALHRALSGAAHAVAKSKSHPVNAVMS